MADAKAKNPMRDLKIRKLCLNICVGESGDRLTRAGKVILGHGLSNSDCGEIVALEPGQSVVSRV